MVDEAGRELEGAAEGGLEVRGDSCAAFYWHQHEKTKASLRGEWFFTGDRYRVDEDGNYVYEGRADDMIKVGGLWVSPIEIENRLAEHPRVVECAAPRRSGRERDRLPDELHALGDLLPGGEVDPGEQVIAFGEVRAQADGPAQRRAHLGRAVGR